jgi:hypothetical protein
MWFRESCFTCDGYSTMKVFPLLYNIGMVINHTRVPFQMREGYVAIQRGGRAPCCVGFCPGSATTQRIALKYVMASEPYRYTIIKNYDT